MDSMACNLVELPDQLRLRGSTQTEKACPWYLQESKAVYEFPECVIFVQASCLSHEQAGSQFTTLVTCEANLWRVSA